MKAGTHRHSKLGEKGKSRTEKSEKKKRGQEVRETDKQRDGLRQLDTDNIQGKQAEQQTKLEWS